MKKFLLSIFCCLMAVFAVQAEEVTFVAEGATTDATNKVTLTGELPGKTFESDYVSFLMTKVNSNNSNVNSNLVRWYKNDIINLTAKKGAKITKVEIATGGATKYQLNVTPNTGSSSISGGIITWSGETSETLELTASEGQIRFATLTVTYTIDEEGGTTEPDNGEGEGGNEEGGTTEPDNGEGEGGNEEGGTTEPDNGEGEGGNEDNNDEETDQPVVEAGTHTATFNALAAGYANGEDITNVTIDSNITATFEKGSGSNAPKYYTTGTAIRCYAKNSFEIKAASGKITDIVLTFGSGDKTNTISTNVGTYADGTWSGDAESVTFTIGGTKDHRRIAEIAVTYTISDNEGEGGNGESGTTEPDNGEGEGEGGNEEGGTTEPDNGEGEGGNEEGGTTEPDNGEGEGGNDNENDEETVEYTAIEFIEADKEATIKGTVVATNAKSFLVEDETGIILVYLNTTPDVNVGEEVTVSGTVTTYGGMPQFPSSSIITKTGVTNEVVYPEATVMDGAAMDAFLSSPEINYVEYTGTLNISSYYNVTIEGAATAVGSIQYPASGFVTATSGAVVKVTGYTIGVISNKYVNTMAITVETVEDAPEEPETPVETKEYTVAEALAAYVDGKQIPAIVTGYIVGAMNSTGYVAEFGTTTVNTNILLADNVDETDKSNCIIVELPKGEIREKLNLASNPDNYKKKLRITGSIETYFRVAGLKNPTDYELLTATTGIKNMDVVTENGVIFDITGRKVENMTVPGIYIVNGKKVLVK